MCKKKKNEPVQPVTETVEPKVSPVSEKTDEQFAQDMLKKEKDYFAYYYGVYKNDYLQQYLDAYRRFQSTGEVDEKVLEMQQSMEKDIDSGNPIE